MVSTQEDAVERMISRRGLLAAAAALGGAVVARPSWPAGTGTQTPRAVDRPDLDVLSDNSWLRLRPASSPRHLCADFALGGMQSPIGEPSGREYGGIHIGGDFVFDFGGGHGAYPGNDVELYTISKNRWDQMYTPETPPITPGAGPYLAICQIGGGWTGPTPNGRPYVEHTYQYFAWDPVNGVFFGLTTSGTWIYDPAKNLWTHLGGGPRGFSFGGPGRWGVFYDPPTGKFHLMITAGDSEGLWTWDGTRWARKPTKWPTSKWSVMYEAYIADRGYHFIICWERFWKYDALASTWTELRDVPWFDSMDYDVVNRRLIVVNHGQTPIIVYVWNPMGDTWTVLPNVTDTPRVKYGRSAMGPLLRYDKDRNVFLFLQQGTAAGGNSNTADTAMWAYRYMK